MASLLQRLKARKLFQWALAYLAGAWLVFQGLEVLAQPWNLSQSIVRAIHVLLGIGFVLALVLAWYHGERGRQHASGPELLMVAALLVIAGAALSLVRFEHEPRSAAVHSGSPGIVAGRPAIAVLPCDNISPDPDDAYLADGIHEEILFKLSKIRSLTTIGRKSVEWYRDNPRPIVDMALELGVGFVGECSVRKDADRGRIRLTFQLLEAGTGGHVWAESYDRDLTAGDLLELESDVAQQVAHSLKAVLTPEERERIETQPTGNLQAYEYFLRGRRFWNQRSLAAFDSAIDYFNRAVLLDPEYARAYAALAETYVLVPEYGGPSIPEMLPLAKAATERALTLDPGLAEAYAASGYLKEVFEWDRDGAERDFLRAIELNPDCATAHQWYAELLGVTRRWDEAVAEARRAVQLDPLSVAANDVLGMVLTFSGRHAEAILARERALEIVPDFAFAILGLAKSYVLVGDYAAAAPLFERLAELTGSDPKAYRAYLAALSDPAEMSAAVTALRSTDVFGDIGNADYLADLGQFEEALALLEQAYEARHPYVPWVNALPHYERMRSDPRFQDLLRRMKFSDD